MLRHLSVEMNATNRAATIIVGRTVADDVVEVPSHKMNSKPTTDFAFMAVGNHISRLSFKLKFQKKKKNEKENETHEARNDETTLLDRQLKMTTSDKRKVEYNRRRHLVVRFSHRYCCCWRCVCQSTAKNEKHELNKYKLVRGNGKLSKIRIYISFLKLLNWLAITFNNQVENLTSTQKLNERQNEKPNAHTYTYRRR